MTIPAIQAAVLDALGHNLSYERGPVLGLPGSTLDRGWRDPRDRGAQHGHHDVWLDRRSRSRAAHLVPDTHDGDPQWVKTVVMEHVDDAALERFVDELARARANTSP